jgi:hypothetical protein
MKARSHGAAHEAPLGTGELHQALTDSRDHAALTEFCSAHVCTPEEVSADGKRLHLPHVLQLMRKRGYQVSEPARSTHQPKAKQGLTAWLVHIRTARVEFDIGFYTVDGVKARPARKPQPTNLEHA